jgi:hypothetical protein
MTDAEREQTLLAALRTLEEQPGTPRAVDAAHYVLHELLRELDDPGPLPAEDDARPWPAHRPLHPLLRRYLAGALRARLIAGVDLDEALGLRG